MTNEEYINGKKDLQRKLKNLRGHLEDLEKHIESGEDWRFDSPSPLFASLGGELDFYRAQLGTALNMNDMLTTLLPE